MYGKWYKHAAIRTRYAHVGLSLPKLACYHGRQRAYDSPTGHYVVRKPTANAGATGSFSYMVAPCIRHPRATKTSHGWVKSQGDCVVCAFPMGRMDHEGMVPRCT